MTNMCVFLISYSGWKATDCVRVHTLPRNHMRCYLKCGWKHCYGWVSLYPTTGKEPGRRMFADFSVKVESTVKIRRTRVPQNAIVPVGRSRPYSIIILHMRFIPKASLRATSQITASSHIRFNLAWRKYWRISNLSSSLPHATLKYCCINYGDQMFF